MTHRRRKLVLLADDDRAMQKIVERMLDNMGYAIACVGNGTDAVKALERESFDLVLMDCEMPELDGYEACRRIREREKTLALPRTPIIALTAHVLFWAREKCIDAGMDDYIPKPIDLATFEGCVNMWIPCSVDKVYLSNLAQLQVDGQPDFVLAAIGNFERLAPGNIARMRQYHANGLAKAVAHESSKLKSVAECAGARRMFELCQHIETAAAKGDLSREVGRSVRLLDAEYLDVIEELRIERLKRKKEIK